MKELILVCLFALSACSTAAKFDDKYGVYVGGTELELVAGLGVPDSTYNVDDSTKLLAYNVNYGSGGLYSAGMVMASNMSCKVTYTIKEKKVQDYKREGNYCKTNK